MTNEEMQKYGKDSMETMMSSFGAWSKSAQAIAVELTDFSKKSLEGSAAAWERLMGAKTLEKAMEVQSDYLKSSYEDFVAETTKLSELYAGLAKFADDLAEHLALENDVLFPRFAAPGAFASLPTAEV